MAFRCLAQTGGINFCFFRLAGCLGLVFLQYGKETKRALLPNEITTIDTVRALFVRSFSHQLTMEYLSESANVRIYIHDANKDVFYELEDLRYGPSCVLPPIRSIRWGQTRPLKGGARPLDSVVIKSKRIESVSLPSLWANNFITCAPALKLTKLMIFDCYDPTQVPISLCCWLGTGRHVLTNRSWSNTLLLVTLPH